MKHVSFAVIAERAADLAACVTFAIRLRAAGHVTDAPLSFSKVKRQLNRARELRPAFLVIIDGERAVIVDACSQARFEASPHDSLAALLELWDDDVHEVRHPLAQTINASFRAWLHAAEREAA